MFGNFYFVLLFLFAACFGLVSWEVPSPPVTEILTCLGCVFGGAVLALILVQARVAGILTELNARMCQVTAWMYHVTLLHSIFRTYSRRLGQTIEFSPESGEGLRTLLLMQTKVALEAFELAEKHMPKGPGEEEKKNEPRKEA